MKEKNWLGIWKTKPERIIVNSEDLITPSVGIVVEVASLPILCTNDIHDDIYLVDP